MISIITPCRNAEKTIERTIESVLSQNIDDFEYIIVDGLSDDNTVGIVKKYMEKDNRIFLISEPDNSMTEALNKGMKLAKGEWVCSINADDEYLLNVLGDVVEYMERTKCDLLFTASNHIKDGRISFRTYPKFMCNQFLLNVLDSSVPECSAFFRRDTLERLGFFDERIKYTQDYEMYIRMSRLGCKVEYLDKLVSNFYLSDDQYSTRLAKQMLDEACEYNKHKIIFYFLKRTHINNKIKVLFGWTIRYKKGEAL